MAADSNNQKPNLPNADDLTRLVKRVVLTEWWDPSEISQSDDDDDYGDDDDNGPWNDLTVGIDTAGDDPDWWGYQTGDNSFTGGAYGYPDWAVVSYGPDTDPSTLVTEILDQLSELYWSRI